jgi:hypothetical protein
VAATMGEYAKALCGDCMGEVDAPVADVGDASVQFEPTCAGCGHVICAACAPRHPNAEACAAEQQGLRRIAREANDALAIRLGFGG